jgi:predicted Zn finger-like uncharacterized protein
MPGRPGRLGPRRGEAQVSLVTRCPTCGTAFRVLPGQLSARAGRVRCGKCGAVFDGIAALVEQGEEPLLLEPSPQLGLFDPRKREPHPAAADDEEPLPAFMAEQPAPRRALWWTLCALAMLALVGQAVYQYRAELAVSVPAARSSLEATCRLLGCRLNLPRHLKFLSIDSYEVRADPQREGVIMLNAVIRNRAMFPQDYPALHFALTDESSRPLTSRVLTPGEYLERDRAAQLIGRGIDPGGEASFTVYFDASRVRATGYHLELFYPS